MLEKLLSALQVATEGPVDLSVQNLREISCFPLEGEVQQKQTSWDGALSGTLADAAGTNTYLGSLATRLQPEAMEPAAISTVTDPDQLGF